MLSLQLNDKILLYLAREAITIIRCDETIHQWESVFIHCRLT